jgi:hypothetical protein
MAGGMILSTSNSSVPLVSHIDAEQSVLKVLYASLIPRVWQMGSIHPFIIETGLDCTTVGALEEKYLSEENAKVAHVCVDGKSYYIASPVGMPEDCSLTGSPGGTPVVNPFCRPKPFSLPRGINQFNGKNWGGITLQEIVIG